MHSRSGLGLQPTFGVASIAHCTRHIAFVRSPQPHQWFPSTSPGPAGGVQFRYQRHKIVRFAALREPGSLSRVLWDGNSSRRERAFLNRLRDSAHGSIAGSAGLCHPWMTFQPRQGWHGTAAPFTWESWMRLLDQTRRLQTSCAETIKSLRESKSTAIATSRTIDRAAVWFR
jgi:hypothetical protein